VWQRRRCQDDFTATNEMLLTPNFLLALHDQFGGNFRLLRHMTEMHQTPAGATQQFTYCYCKISDAT